MKRKERVENLGEIVLEAFEEFSSLELDQKTKALRPFLIKNGYDIFDDIVDGIFRKLNIFDPNMRLSLNWEKTYHCFYYLATRKLQEDFDKAIKAKDFEGIANFFIEKYDSFKSIDNLTPFGPSKIFIFEPTTKEKSVIDEAEKLDRKKGAFPPLGRIFKGEVYPIHVLSLP